MEQVAEGVPFVWQEESGIELVEDLHQHVGVEDETVVSCLSWVVVIVRGNAVHVTAIIVSGENIRGGSIFIHHELGEWNPFSTCGVILSALLEVRELQDWFFGVEHGVNWKCSLSMNEVVWNDVGRWEE